MAAQLAARRHPGAGVAVPRAASRRIGESVVALITQTRLEHRFGASRARIWLERVIKYVSRQKRFSPSSATSACRPS
jgi:hypothetical protein